MLADGDEDSAEDAIVYLDALQQLDGNPAPGTSPAKQRTYIYKAPRAIDFLIGQGIQLQRGGRLWPDYYDELPGGAKPLEPSLPSHLTSRNLAYGGAGCGGALRNTM